MAVSKRVTKAEAGVLREAAPEIQRFLSGVDMAKLELRASAYRKVAQAARAEREAIMEVRLLDLIHAADDPGTVLHETRRALESTQSDLEAERERNRSIMQRLAAVTAGPAMAVHSGEDE